MNYKDLKNDLGDNPKVTNLLVSMVELLMSQHAILQSIIASQAELMAYTKDTSIEEQASVLKEKVDKAYAELRAENASFILSSV